MVSSRCCIVGLYVGCVETQIGMVGSESCVLGFGCEWVEMGV